MAQYSKRHSTVIQDTLKIGQKHSIVLRAQERVSELRTQQRAAHAHIHTHAHKRAAGINEKAEPDTSAPGQHPWFFSPIFSIILSA